jgi:hypothetical protein
MNSRLPKREFVKLFLWFFYEWKCQIPHLMNLQLPKNEFVKHFLWIFFISENIKFNLQLPQSDFVKPFLWFSLISENVKFRIWWTRGCQRECLSNSFSVYFSYTYKHIFGGLVHHAAVLVRPVQWDAGIGKSTPYGQGVGSL